MRIFQFSLLFAITFLSCSTVVVPVSPAFSKTYTYELIPKQNTLSYATQASDTWHVVYTGVEGSFQFQVDGGGAIVSQKFDLTITGPFHDSLLEPVDWAPFAPGDALADFLTVDFANTTGLEIAMIPFNGAENNGRTRAYIGPDVAGDSSMVFLGKNYYEISQLEIDPAIFFFQAEARAEIGGSFSIFPPADLSHTVNPPISFPGEGDPPYFIYPAVASLARLLPNVRLVPEPTSMVLLGFAGVTVGLSSRRRFWPKSWR